MILIPPLQLIPQYREYIWGGSKLRPGVANTAEAWVVYEANRIMSGPLAEVSLADAAAEFGESLLGRRVIGQTGLRFPLLIKLLDCAQWLSLQVHPNDEQAARLEGNGFYGKTEAWHILEADDGAQIISGLAHGASPEILSSAIQNGTIAEIIQYFQVKAGNTIFMPPGTIHAIGPGLLLYEVQQSSDLTYRVYDWGRPQTKTRQLHIEKSLAVVDAAARAQLIPPPHLQQNDRKILSQCSYFTLEILQAYSQPLILDTQGETFHALTVIDGSAAINAGGSTIVLNHFESAVVPAACGEYQLLPKGRFRLLKASIEAF